MPSPTFAHSSQKGARDRNALALTTGQPGTAFANVRLVTAPTLVIDYAADELVRPGELGGVLDLGLRG
jgi:hypothetical protein